MPMIDLTYLRGSVKPLALEQLTDELVTPLLRAERAPDTPFLRDNTVVYLHELDSGAQSDVHAAVCTATGIEPQGARAFHVWTLIHEIPEGNWAGGGKVIYYRQVKGLVADDAP
jgi:hypothetical protein